MRIAGQTIETAEDVQRICAEGWFESQQLEFTQPPIKPGKVAREVVALTNHLGGHVLLGIGEKKIDGRKRAAEIHPIANCAAEALGRAQSLAEAIDPPIRGLVVKPIVTHPDGAGIIIIEVPQSLFGPHRSKIDNEVFLRSGEESRSQSMTEIHRLVLAFEKREDRVEQRFQAIRGPAGQPFNAARGKFCMRAAAVPLGDVRIDLEKMPQPWLTATKVRTRGGSEGRRAVGLDGATIRPGLRSKISTRQTEKFHWQVNVGENGTAQVLFICRTPPDAVPSVTDMIAALHSLLALIHKIAFLADYPGGEFGIEIECGADQSSDLAWFSNDSYGEPVTTGLHSRSFFLPRYRYAPGDDKLELTNTFWTDFWNILERDPPDLIASVEIES